MAKARKKGLAALLASLFALVLAAFLCMGMPARDAHAQDETQYNVGGDGIDTPEELLLAYAGLQSGGGTIDEVIQAEKTVELLKYSVVVITALPFCLLYPFIQKYFTKGTLLGSVKG